MHDYTSFLLGLTLVAATNLRMSGDAEGECVGMDMGMGGAKDGGDA